MEYSIRNQPHIEPLLLSFAPKRTNQNNQIIKRCELIKKLLLELACQCN